MSTHQLLCPPPTRSIVSVWTQHSEMQRMVGICICGCLMRWWCGVVKWPPSASSNLTLCLTGRTLHFLPLRLTRLLCGWKVGHKCCFGKKFLVFYTHLGPKTNNESATILNLLFWSHKETPVDVMQTPDNTHGVRHQQKLDKMFCFQQISTKLFGSCLTILYSL